MLVCSIAHPSLFTDVTAMESVVASLSHGTTSAVTCPCARAYSSIARETTCGEPAAMKSTFMASLHCGLRIAACGLRRADEQVFIRPIRSWQSTIRTRSAIPIRNPHVLDWPGGRTSSEPQCDTRSGRCQAPRPPGPGAVARGERADTADQENADRRGDRRPDPRPHS